MSALHSPNPPRPSSSPALHLQSFLSHQTSAKATAIALAASSSSSSASSSTSQSLEDKQYHVWNLIFDVASQNPDCHGDLISLLEAFVALEDEEDEKLRLWGGKDLGRFAQVWRGRWELLHGQRHDPPTPNSPSPSSSTLYIHFTTFSAHLATLPFVNVDLVFGFFTIRDILEFRLPLALASGSNSHQIITDLRAAAQWILVAGEDMYRADNKEVSEVWRRGMGKETPLWKGEGGWSRERWGLWRERFEVLAEELGLGLGEEVRRVARGLVGRMEGIQRERGV